MKKKLQQLLVIFFVPIFFIIIFIRPIIHIRWCTNYFSDRIGHLVSEMEHYFLFKKKNKEKSTLDLFPSNLFYNNNSSNLFLLKHYGNRVITVNHQFIRLLQETQKLVKKIFKEYKFLNFDNYFSTRDEYGLFNNRFKPSIKFTNTHNINGRSVLSKIGIKKNEKYVCVIVRDSEYLKSRFSSRKWNYHNYRDSNINNYKLGIKHLINQGYWVIRMGRKQKCKLNMGKINFFDYSFSNIKSDFLDVWLLANCEFCISTGTGLDHVPRIFNKPTLYINHLPLLDWHSYLKSLTHPKHLYDLKKKKYLNLVDYVQNSYFRSEEYEQKNLRVIEMSKKEILYCIKEFLELKKNNWKISKKYQKLQNKFNQQFLDEVKTSHQNIKFHNKINKNALISKLFLNNKKLTTIR